MSAQFIGAGWAAFDVRTDATGGIALVTGEREIEEAIDFADKSPHPDPSEILEDVYAPLG